jgi:hypothetical protein
MRCFGDSDQGVDIPEDPKNILSASFKPIPFQTSDCCLAGLAEITAGDMGTRNDRVDNSIRPDHGNLAGKMRCSMD